MRDIGNPPFRWPNDRGHWWHDATSWNDQEHTAAAAPTRAPIGTIAVLSGAATTHLGARRCASVRATQAVRRKTACLERVAGPRWVAVGNVARAYDPLNGSGVAHALRD